MSFHTLGPAKLREHPSEDLEFVFNFLSSLSSSYCQVFNIWRGCADCLIEARQTNRQDFIFNPFIYMQAASASKKKIGVSMF